jgi:hypothetical protein
MNETYIDTIYRFFFGTLIATNHTKYHSFSYNQASPHPHTTTHTLLQITVPLTTRQSDSIHTSTNHQY